MKVSIEDKEIIDGIISGLSNNGFKSVASGKLELHKWKRHNCSFLKHYHLEIATGATKFCFISDLLKNWVVKIPMAIYSNFFNKTQNYCELEENNYRLAKQEELHFYFAETKHYADCFGISYYLQEKCDLVPFELETLIGSRVSTSFVNSFRYDCSTDDEYGSIDYDEMMSCLEADEVAHFVFQDEVLTAFISKYKINDLHCRNIGKRKSNGQYCLIDFSGYYG